ncbi:MAG: hypothetical protein GXP18_11215 [Gammaproteobacteria bacterium]|nr:hypothetical protein [Gammaproteobacteria bacterium]
MNRNTRSMARNGFRKHSLALALAAGFTTALAAGAAQAATWDVTITNLTNGNHFTPLLVTAHDSDTHLFQVGMPASLPIEHMAECGHLDPLFLTPEVGAADADTIDNPATGLLAPGTSTSAMLVTTETHLSIVAMVLPTNDAFLGLESQYIPSEAGTYTYYVNAYDAGTEANDEMLMTAGECAYTDSGMIPGAPGMDAGMNGTGVATADSNTMIHVHRGVLGDQDETGGTSDLNSTIHRWQNPVAKITVVVTP